MMVLTAVMLTWPAPRVNVPDGSITGAQAPQTTEVTFRRQYRFWSAELTLVDLYPMLYVAL